MIVMGRRPKDMAELMNELVVGGAKRDEILGIVGSPSSDALNMMDMQPALVWATVAVSVDEGAPPTVTGVDGVEFVRREGLALGVRRISGRRARFCARGL